MIDAIFSLNTLWWFLVIFYVPACIGLIVIVLLQKGKGTGFAGAFGVGPGSEAVFGPRSRQTLPVRLTYVFAATFMIIALIMSIISGELGRGQAPALVEAAEGQPPVTGLEDLGIGSATPGAATTDEAAPVTNTPQMPAVGPESSSPAPAPAPEADEPDAPAEQPQAESSGEEAPESPAPGPSETPQESPSETP